MEYTYKILDYRADTAELDIEYRTDSYPHGVRVIVGILDPGTNQFFDPDRIREKIDQYFPRESLELINQIQALELPEHVLELKNSVVKNEPDPLETAMFLRAQKLYECDYTQLPDVPLSEELKAAYVIYRQALRDLPSTEGWPNNISWPVKPE